MYERVRLSYQSASGQEINLTDWPFYWNESDLQAHAWEIESTDNPFGSKITRLRRGVTEKSVKLLIYNSGNSVKAFVDHLNAVFESDVVAKTPGKLLFNESYLSGYFTAASLSGRMRDVYAEYELTFTTDNPFWITEASTEFITFSESSEVGKRFPYKFPHRYATAGIRTLINEHYAPTPAIITIYGPALDPSISIDGQIYQMTISMATGERLILDGLSRRIYRKLITGEEVNEFNRRDKNNDPFRPIPPGTLPVVYNGSFSFDITLIQQRSEPRWGG